MVRASIKNVNLDKETWVNTLNRVLECKQIQAEKKIMPTILKNKQ